MQKYEFEYRDLAISTALLGFSDYKIPIQRNESLTLTSCSPPTSQNNKLRN